MHIGPSTFRFGRLVICIHHPAITHKPDHFRIGLTFHRTLLHIHRLLIGVSV
tara:strand:- start:530 stop:685 length:156 start_codon:yes stop_codon:yes gene_type:complete